MNNKFNQEFQSKPQEPKPPFPYKQQEVFYENKSAGITLAGTLTLSAFHQKLPVVLLIAGSGPHDRDMNFLGHKLLLVIADYLTRNGIAVLRVDKRGVGKSTGNYAAATSEDFASDVQAGVEYLKTRNDINVQQIGLIGLSEGGMIAPMIAAKCRDVAFLILLAPAVTTKSDDLIEMLGLQMKADGAHEGLLKKDAQLRKEFFAVIQAEPNNEKATRILRTLVENYWTGLAEAEKQESQKIHFAFTPEKTEEIIKTFTSPWYRFFLSYNPVETLQKIKVPILVLNGDRDWIAYSKKTLPLIKQALETAGNNDVTIRELQHISHMFQTTQIGALAEYALNEETIAPHVLTIIKDWVLARTK